MGKINDFALPPGRPERRKHRRFSVSYPIKVKWRLKDSVSEVQAFTHNVSVGGLLLEIASSIPQDCPVHFVMTLHGGPVIHPIRVMGEGEVVRVEPHGPDAGFHRSGDMRANFLVSRYHVCGERHAFQRVQRNCEPQRKRIAFRRNIQLQPHGSYSPVLHPLR